MDLIPFTDDQKRYLLTVFTFMEANGVWPKFSEIDRYLYITSGLNGEVIAKGLNREIFGTPWSPADQRITLRLRVVAMLEGSEKLLKLVLAAVRLAVDTDFAQEGSVISSSQIRQEWPDIPETEVRCLGALLYAEPFIWSGGYGPNLGFRGPDENGDNWTMGIGRNIREFRNVTTVEAMIDALPPLLEQPAPTVIGALTGSLKDVPMHALSPVPVNISESLAHFRSDHPDPSKAAFIMMQFAETDAHHEITAKIKETLDAQGLIGLRADDKTYHEDTYWNIATYMWGCGFGVAVFERIESNIYNPNVSLEVGYMLGLGKKVCFLKDRTLEKLNTDLLGKLYTQFDTRRIDQTLPRELTKWLKDMGFTGE
jgi:hypothetical protein